MKKWFNTNSLKFNLWKYFAVFTVAIMLLLWILQIIFLNAFYKSMKMVEIKKVAKQIISEYTADDDTFDEQLFYISVKNGINARIVDENGDVICGGSSFRARAQFDKFQQQISDAIKDGASYNEKNLVPNNDLHGRQPKNEDRMILYSMDFKDDGGNALYLYIESFLEPVGATKMVLQNQLLWVTVISVILAFVLSYFIAKKLARPISDISEAAKTLARGDYNVLFSEEGYSEISELGKSMNYMTDELAKTEELRRDLISNVSHDLRTPLTIIKSYAEMIRDISGDNKVKREAHTQVIIDESNRLSLLVSDLLDLSKMQSGTDSLDISRFNLSDTVRRIMTNFEILHENNGYNFELGLENDCFACADEQKISRVIYNLINNAINYTGDDKRVAIFVKKRYDSNIEFSVTDTGKGISKEEQKKVFERYYKSSKTHTREVLGSGIGLAIVKGILTAHNAEFGVDSELMKGSTFWFRLKSAKEE